MTTGTERSMTGTERLRRGGLVAAVLMVGVFGISACSIVHKIKNAVHTVEGNKSTIDAFTTKLQSGAPTTFEATYATSGATPATIVYAVQPPKGLAFSETPTGGSNGSTAVHIVVNSSGDYSCSPPSSAGASWTCEKLGAADAATQNKIYDFYTPSHWVSFLKGFSLAAGLAGDKVTSSTMTVNGFPMSCVDFVATGEPGTSTICSTAQGLLGYVKVATDSTSFEIEKYSSSPPASLFALPPGATVTSSPTPQG
ncbi:MAG: hypothetical protein ACLPVF_03365 [Acidimicrobiales bacterium]